jgi:hypothetical protein
MAAHNHLFRSNHSVHTSTNRIKQLRAQNEVFGQVVRAGPRCTIRCGWLIGRRLRSGRYGAAGRPLIHKPGMTLIGVQWSAAADKRSRCPDKGATYVGNGGCGSFYALSVTSVLTPIASKIFWSRAIPTVW